MPDQTQVTIEMIRNSLKTLEELCNKVETIMNDVNKIRSELVTERIWREELQKKAQTFLIGE